MDDSFALQHQYDELLFLYSGQLASFSEIDSLYNNQQQMIDERLAGMNLDFGDEKRAANAQFEESASFLKEHFKQQNGEILKQIQAIESSLKLIDGQVIQADIDKKNGFLVEK